MVSRDLADQRTERAIREITDSPSELRIIRALYQSREDTVEQGRRWNDVHHEPIEESQSVQQQELHSNHQPNRIEVFWSELSRRVKDAVQNARERIAAFTERFRTISDHSDQSDARDQKIVEIERGISDRKRAITGLGESVENHERISTQEQRTIGEAKQSINDSFEQTERTNRELGTTIKAVDQKIEKDLKQDRGWSMSR